MENITVSIKAVDLATFVRKLDLAEMNERYYKDTIKKLESEIENLKKQLEEKENEQ